MPRTFCLYFECILRQRFWKGFVGSAKVLVKSFGLGLPTSKSLCTIFGDKFKYDE